jgi:hypothetical protein
MAEEAALRKAKNEEDHKKEVTDLSNYVTDMKKKETKKANEQRIVT